jgi:hypothetical protein
VRGHCGAVLTSRDRNIHLSKKFGQTTDWRRFSANPYPLSGTRQMSAGNTPFI